MEPSPLGGLAIACRRVEHPRATVVAIHGGLDRASSFTRLSRRLDDFDVVAYDRRGYQDSRSVGPGTLDDHVSDLNRIMTWSAGAGPVVLFGHSFGGLIAMTLVSRRPSAAPLVVSFESPLPWVLSRPMPTPGPSVVPSLESEIFFRRVVSDAAWEHLSHADQESRRLDGAALGADLRAMAQAQSPFELRDIQSPVRYLYGDSPSAGYYHALARRLDATNAKFTSRELAGAPHGAHLSHPTMLASEIRRAFELWWS